MVRKLTTFLVVIAVLLFATGSARADDPCAATPLAQQPDCYLQKISETQGTERTLSSQIDLLNNQIALTASQINLTQQKIDQLSSDIASVSGKITVVEDQLQHVSEVLVNRIVATYIQGRTDPVLYLLSSANFGDFFRRMEYLQLVQKHDQDLMLQMAITRKNYHDQKNLFELKKQEKEALAVQLAAEKTQLNLQNREKQQLLEETQNSEAIYQQKLAAARAQLAAFQGFVASEGGASLLSGQTKCDDWGCYYNQRDTQWGANTLNHTGYTLADSGCLVTSMAMVATHYGHRDVTPQTINSSPSNFAVYFPAYLNRTIIAAGVSFSRQGISYSQIDSELSAGRPVVVGVGYGPSHFVVLVSGSNGSYTMNDPYVPDGRKISFSSKYSLGSITEVDKVVLN